MPLWMIDGASSGYCGFVAPWSPSTEALLSRNQSPEDLVPISEPQHEPQRGSEGEVNGMWGQSASPGHCPSAISTANKVLICCIVLF